MSAMMTVTKAVLEILTAADDDRVRSAIDGQVYLRRESGGMLLVTRSVFELRDAGLLTPPPLRAAVGSPQSWTLTAAGREAIHGRAVAA